MTIREIVKELQERKRSYQSEYNLIDVQIKTSTSMDINKHIKLGDLNARINMIDTIIGMLATIKENDDNIESEDIYAEDSTYQDWLRKI